MHLLIVEDEARILSFLHDALSAEGHSVESCATYDSALTTLQNPVSSKFDAVILDRMLQGKEGAKLIPFIRAKNPASGILVLSAINTPEEKAAVLDLGADDYLGKPFSLEELSARVRVLSRRMSGSSTNKIRLGNSELDLVAHTLQIAGKKCDLPHREFQVLCLFMQNPGKVFNRFQILDRVWNAQYDIESNVVEVTINNIRRKIETEGSSFQLLSKRNIGYWLET